MIPEKHSILFIAPYPFGRVASQRFRFEQYWEHLVDSGYKTDFRPFLSEKAFDRLYQKGQFAAKVASVLVGFLKRCFLLLRIANYDVIFVHREATPIGIPFVEWIITHVYKKKLIYDFDDAIWIENTSEANRIISFIRCQWKVASICKWAWKVCCGNDFLADFARLHNPHTTVIPTTLDTDKLPVPAKKLQPLMPVIGWTGTHSTLKYLYPIIPVLQELEALYPFTFLVIADKDPQLSLHHYRFQKWRKASEWRDLAQVDIGLMPLGTHFWEEGKCGFKALQYMSLGIPALVSPTRANNKIIHSGQNGFICETASDWKSGILSLLKDESLYMQFSENGRQTIDAYYSKRAWQDRYQALFEA